MESLGKLGRETTTDQYLRYSVLLVGIVCFALKVVTASLVCKFGIVGKTGTVVYAKLVVK